MSLVTFSKLRPPGKRLIKRQLVRGFEPAAGGKSVRDASKRDRKRFEELDEIIRGRLPFHIRGERENDLREFLGFDSRQQLLDPQIIGPDVIERRDAAA